jgi:hypothetical protein
MILLRGKVGHRRLHEPRQVRLAGLSFLLLFFGGWLFLRIGFARVCEAILALVVASSS